MKELVIKGYRRSSVTPARAAEWRADIEHFNAEYCAVLDTNNVELWPEFFTDDCIYRVTARENAELDMLVGLVYAEGKPMLVDRAIAISRTQMFAPRHMLHVLSPVRVMEEDEGDVLCQCNFMLLQTLVEGPTTVHMAGVYHDRLTRVNGALLLRERQVVYDTSIIANDLVYPV